MFVHGTENSAHRTLVEVVGQAYQLAVDGGHLLLRVQERPAATGHLADLPAEPLDLLLRGESADEGASRLWRVTAAEGVTQEVKRLVWDAAELRFGFVHRQLQPTHHVPHHAHGLVGRAATADHVIVGIVDDSGAKTPLVSQRLPAQDEPPHREVRKQWRDRSPLRATPTLVFVPGRSMPTPAIVDLFHRCLEPHLDQAENVPINDAT